MRIAVRRIGADAGVDATFESTRIVTDIFKRMIVNQEFDVAGLGWTYYLRTLDFDEPPFIAIPVFPNRVFRHSAIYVNTSSGIEKPQVSRFGTPSRYRSDNGLHRRQQSHQCLLSAWTRRTFHRSHNEVRPPVWNLNTHPKDIA